MNNKIAVIIERADIALGGAERSVFELAAALTAHGLNVDILAAKGHRQSENIKILCRDSFGKRSSYLTFSRKLSEYLAQNQYDIIHSVLPFNFAHIYQPRGGTYAETILRNAASYENKLMQACKKLTAFANFRRKILLQAERNLCRLPNGPKVIAISQYVAEQLRQHYALPDERIAIVPNGIRIPAATNMEKADRLRRQILSRLDFNEDGKAVIFLFAARNFRLKGLSPLLKALRTAVNNSNNNAFLIVVGSSKTQEYQRLANRLNIHKKVLFLGAVRNIRNVMSISNVAVLPTFYDPCSRFILEALAFNKPVITTRFNGAADMFINGRHGIVIEDPQDIRALTKALCHFTKNDNIQTASRAIASDNLREKISVDRVAKQIISVYSSIRKQRGGTPGEDSRKAGSQTGG